MDKIYKDLVELPGCSTFERDVRKYVKAELEKHADEIIMDNLGGIFAVKKSKDADAPTVMVAGHMDEVGFMVTDITKEGLLKLTNLGGLIPEVCLGQHLELHTPKGMIPGVISTVAPHLLRGAAASSKKMEISDLLFDIGADNKDHAKELGANLGQQVTFKNNFTETIDGKKVISKAWDDRWGCGMAIELLREVANVDLGVNLVVGCTVQEEVGLRGAQVASQMVNPDMFIAVDVSPANDFGMGKGTIWGRLGEGTLLRFHDPRCVMHRGLREYYIETAEECGAKYQWFQSKGGTDAAVAQYAGDGTLAMTIGVCARYIHTATSMLHKADHEAARTLLHHLIKKLNKDEVAKIKANV